MDDQKFSCQNMKGGSLTAQETRDFVRNSYKKKHEVKPVGDFKLDHELSTTRNKVFHDAKTGKTVVANAGTSKASDWLNNVVIAAAPSLYEKTNRFKEAARVQKKAAQKYGQVDTNVAHSQSAFIVQKMNKKNGLVNEAIVVNPASRGKKQKANTFVIKSELDPVSVLNRSKNTTKIKTGTWNPLTNHSAEILEKINPMTVFGKGFMATHFY